MTDKRMLKSTVELQQLPLNEMTAYVVALHHDYIRQTIPVIQTQLQTWVVQCGASLSWASAVQQQFAHIAGDLLQHIGKEDAVLFPCINAIQRAAMGEAVYVLPPFGSVRNPIRMMMREHETGDEQFAALFQLMDSAPSSWWASAQGQVVLAALRAFADDFVVHNTLENQLLFPRAIAAEQAVLARTGAGAGQG